MQPGKFGLTCLYFVPKAFVLLQRGQPEVLLPGLASNTRCLQSSTIVIVEVRSSKFEAGFFATERATKAILLRAGYGGCNVALGAGSVGNTCAYQQSAIAPDHHMLR